MTQVTQLEDEKRGEMGIEEDELLEVELNQNMYYKNYLKGMDESGSSFYIESLKNKLER